MKKIAEEKKEGEKKKEGEGEEKKTTKKELKKEKAEKAKKKKVERVIVGNLTMEQCIKVMKMKQDSLLAKTMKSAVKEVVASVVSMPLTVEGKSPKDVLKEIDQGKYDGLLKEG